ncbi:hypothetical protein AGMMS49579_15220 [Spirochaetia bacterium]|nr:hypothetical protein AGMMS49579_15220 [Spirochaetia bacterium]
MFKVIKAKGLSAFTFLKSIDQKTSQGSVGYLECIPKYEPFIEKYPLYVDGCIDLLLYKKPKKRIIIVYKISIETPFLCEHEFLIGKSLFKVRKYLPYFIRPYDLLTNIAADPTLPNPFKGKSLTDVILYEHIDNDNTLSLMIEKYMNNKTFQSKKEIDSVINQILIALLITQDKLNFSHNDLHFDNILICKCYERTFILYIFTNNDETFSALIPTYGYYPSIIDYGYSYTKDLINRPLLTGIYHDNKGYINYMYDEFTDFKTLTTKLLYINYINDDKIRNNFINKLPIKKNTGWDKNDCISISNYVIKYLKDFIHDTVFKVNIYDFVDILGGLIILPLQSKNTNNIEEHMNIFIEEWLKIEKWFEKSCDKIYIFKNMVKCIQRDIIENEINYDTFRNKIYEIVDSMGSNILLNDINFKYLYNSLINIAEIIEGIMYKQHLLSHDRKEKEYKNLKNIKTSLDIYKMLEPHITHDYTIKLHDYFIVCDAIEEESYSFTIDSQKDIDLINKLPMKKRANCLLKQVKEEFIKKVSKY